MTLYDVKPAFQSLLRPSVAWLAKHKVTANQVTICAAVGSVLLGVCLYLFSHISSLFLLVPLWMLLRMALNAIDGMLAREFNQQSKLGAYLNELSDLIADAALFIPFALISPFSITGVASFIFIATLSEFAGLQGSTIGASRRYDGPLGKSDRALVFGILGLWLGVAGALPHWLSGLMPLLCLLAAITMLKRIHNGLNEAQATD